MQTIEDLGAELRNAAKEGNLEIVGMILAQPEVNTEILNAQDKAGLTALMWAVEKGNVGVVKVLLAHRDDKGNYPVDIGIIGDIALAGQPEISQLISAHQLLTNPWTALQRSSLFIYRNRVGILISCLVVAAAERLYMHSQQVVTIPHKQY